MEYLGYTRHRNLNTDAESEKSNKLINNLISHRSQPLNKPLSLLNHFIHYRVTQSLTLFLQLTASITLFLAEREKKCCVLCALCVLCGELKTIYNHGSCLQFERLIQVQPDFRLYRLDFIRSKRCVFFSRNQYQTCFMCLDGTFEAGNFRL